MSMNVSRCYPEGTKVLFVKGPYKGFTGKYVWTEAGSHMLIEDIHNTNHKFVHPTLLVKKENIVPLGEIGELLYGQ